MARNTKTYFLLINGLKQAETYTSRDEAFEAAIAADNGTDDIEICTTHRGLWVCILSLAEISA